MPRQILANCGQDGLEYGEAIAHLDEHTGEFLIIFSNYMDPGTTYSHYMVHQNDDGTWNPGPEISTNEELTYLLKTNVSKFSGEWTLFGLGVTAQPDYFPFKSRNMDYDGDGDWYA